MEDPPPQRWDRGKWITVFSSHSPTIREITECLGLYRAPSASTTNRGIPKFDAIESKKLSSEVQRLSKDLPKDRDALLDFAADPNSLDYELDELLATLGPAIWGREADRDRLLVAPDDTKKTYYKDLFLEDPDDRNILKIHLHRWIIIKACYYIRNMKLKRPSAADEYETVADIDIDSPDKPKLVSPIETPRSGTPVVADNDSGSTQLTNPRKRKSDIYRSFSDGEENAGTDSASAAKKRYHSATMPIQRKSPRKSLATARLSSENIPPTPSPINHLQAPAPPVVANSPTPPDATRLLSPLSSSALNGAPRPTNGVSSAFTAVNNQPASGFTAVNTAPAPNDLAVQPVPAGNSTPANAGMGSYASPYSVPIAPNPQSAPSESNEHEDKRSAAAPAYQREISRQSTPIAHAPHHQTPPMAPATAAPAPVPIAQAGPHAQPAFHNHSMPHSANVHHPVQAPAATQPMVPSGPVRAPPVLMSNGPPPGQPLPQINGQHAHQHPQQQPQQPQQHHPQQHPQQLPQHLSQQHPQSRNGSLSSRLPADTTLLQCELLGHLMRYFFPRDGPQCDEVKLFNDLEFVWTQNELVFERVMGKLLRDQRDVLFAWIEERRKIGQLQRAISGQQALEGPEMVDRLLAMNDLRVMRLKWKAMKAHDGNQNLSPEDLLCKTLATMTKTEGTEHLFKDGLDRLNESVFGWLRSEDMKISMHIKRSGR